MTNPQSEEQLEQASAPQSLDISFHIPFLDQVKHKAAHKMSSWLGNINPDWPIEIVDDNHGNLTLIYKFEEELDALAFRLMFSEYL
ncbi:hypothetical protein [Burkholderia multivorans]|uniref:hypothetical protein n=1 Tax=Burkholderia multivorans TaxID=87883 RepID=UPI0011B27635|nr:hypothetical protein [Burkholderia multivorans]